MPLAFVPSNSCDISTSPGQVVVLETWWADRIGSVTSVPLGHRALPPPDTSSVEPPGLTWSSSSFQAMIRSMLFTIAEMTGSGVEPEKVPSARTPTDPSLKPPAWEPSTGLSMPPQRPSQMVPQGSTMKL